MKKKQEEHESDERWLVSYADFITLLMVLFVVLYSIGQVDVKKYQRMAESMRAAFAGGQVKVIDAQINQGSGENQDGKPNPITIPGIPQKPPEAQEVAGELTAMLSAMNLGSAVSVQTNIEGVLISLSEKLVFAPGTAKLQKNAFAVLDTIAQMISPVDNPIRIVGHTDNTPPTDPKYTNNWELSVGRAIVISSYLISKGIAPDRMIVSGRSEYEPVFKNDTSEHKALNSRADIVVIYKSSTNKVIDTSPIIADPVMPNSANAAAPSSGGTK